MTAQQQVEDFNLFGVHVIDGAQDAFAALITEDTKRIFDYETVNPVQIKPKYRGYVPWGEDNLMPYTILEKIRDDEVMSSNMQFNILTAYGRGFTFSNPDGKKVTDERIRKFFRRNNMIKYWAEQWTDIKHFYFSVAVVILDNAGDNIVQIRHKEAINCRFETCNNEGIIENVFYANWQDNPKNKDVEAIPLLDFDDPIGDLMVRLGKEIDPEKGEKREKTKDRIFAFVNRMPTAGEKYYPFPYYFSTFNSGWSQLKAAIPQAKLAKMRNGMALRYLVEMHENYFSKLFAAENITDATEKKARRKLEIENIKNFVAGVDNQSKSWFSTYYIDPNGKEINMVRITRVDTSKEGGDWIEDSEEAANIVSYAMGVHPSLIGSSPGKNKSINGTEARELFTMKQGLERLPRDIMLQPFYMINEVNGWDLEYDIPDLMLTTLDQKTDAVTATSKQQNDDTNNA